MEVNALTRWNSLGSELFKLGEQHLRIQDESPWRQEFPEFVFIGSDIERATSPPTPEEGKESRSSISSWHALK